MSDRTILRRVTHGLWSYLPTWLCASAAICVFAALTVVLTPGLTPPAVLVAAVLLTPWSVATLAAADQVVRNDDVTVRFWWRALRRHAGFGYSVVAAPAVTTALFLVAYTVWQRTGAAIALVPVVVSGAVSVLLGLAATAVLPLGIARPTLRGTRLWLTASYLVARWPIRFLAGPAMLGFVVWLATEISASLLLLAPAPVALVMCAAFWTSATDLDPAALDTDDAELSVGSSR